MQCSAAHNSPHKTGLQHTNCAPVSLVQKNTSPKRKSEKACVFTFYNSAGSSNVIKALHTDALTTRTHACMHEHTHTHTNEALHPSRDRLLVLCLMQYLIDPTQEVWWSQMHSVPPPRECLAACEAAHSPPSLLSSSVSQQRKSLIRQKIYTPTSTLAANKQREA